MDIEAQHPTLRDVFQHRFGNLRCFASNDPIRDNELYLRIACIRALPIGPSPHCFDATSTKLMAQAGKSAKQPV